MSTCDNMSKLPGLQARDSVYQLRVVFPLDLRTAFDGRTKVVHSPKTSDRREAAIERAKREPNYFRNSRNAAERSTRNQPRLSALKLRDPALAPKDQLVPQIVSICDGHPIGPYESCFDS